MSSISFEKENVIFQFLEGSMPSWATFLLAVGRGFGRGSIFADKEFSQYLLMPRAVPNVQTFPLATSILGLTAYNIRDIIIARVISGGALPYQPTNQQMCVDNAKRS